MIFNCGNLFSFQFPHYVSPLSEGEIDSSRSCYCHIDTNCFGTLPSNLVSYCVLAVAVSRCVRSMTVGKQDGINRCSSFSVEPCPDTSGTLFQVIKAATPQLELYSGLK